MEERNRGYFYKDWLIALEDEPYELKGEVYDALMRYSILGEEPKLQGVALMAYKAMKQAVDRDMDKYYKKVNANRENGKKGGRPKKNPQNPLGFSETQETQTNPQKGDKIRLDTIRTNTTYSEKDNKKENTKRKSADAPFLLCASSPSEGKASSTSQNNPPSPYCARPLPQGPKEREMPRKDLPYDDRYAKYREWLMSKAPYIFEHYTNLITEREFNKLTETYTTKELSDTIENIENRQDLRKKYTNLFRTVTNWLNKPKVS